MSISKVKLIKKCSLPLSQFIEKERLIHFNQIYNKDLRVYDIFELNKIKEFLPKNILIENTYFFKGFKVDCVDIDYSQNLLKYPDDSINFISVKIDFILISRIYNFHYPNEDCDYLLEDLDTNYIYKVNPSDLEDDDISVLNVS